MTLKARTVGLVLPGLFLVGIGIAIAMGYWNTESSKEPRRIETGDFAGAPDPADIRGSYTLNDVAASFDIGVDELARAFGVAGEENPGSVQAKIFEERYGEIDGLEVGTDSLRLFVSLALGMPYSPEDQTALPNPAKAVLRDRGVNVEAWEDRFVSMEAAFGEITPTEDHEQAVGQAVTGRTTFGDLLGWGLDLEDIEIILGTAMGDRSESVRDWCESQGREFSAVKVALQEALDQSAASR